MSDKELIQLCLREIRSKSGYAESGPLRQRDLEHLSTDIEQRTGILISVSTIKRLLNGQFNQLPQAATLNAITTYIGYDGWQDFRVKKQGEHNGGNGGDELGTLTPAVPTSKKNSKRYYGAIFGFGGMFLLAIASYSFLSKPESVNADDVLFAVRKITSNDIPNTVVFEYDVSNVRGDSFFIQQAWDPDRRVKIEKTNHTLTDIYYEPGYHNAKLIVNNTVVKTIDVNIPTNGWFFYMKPELFKGMPTYIQPSRPVANGILSLQPEDIISSKIDPQRENFYTYSFFPEKFDTGSDNFRFAAKVRFKQLRNVACPLIMYEICGQRNALFFFTTLPGCTGNINANVGEHFLSGKTTDLSGFGCDVQEWHDIEVIVKEKNARFFIDQKEIFSRSFTESPGLVTGLMLSSNGLCEIDQLELAGLDGTVVYKDDFNN